MHIGTKFFCDSQLLTAWVGVINTSTVGTGTYIGMARVPHVRNTNMHRKISVKTEGLAVKGCYY